MGAADGEAAADVLFGEGRAGAGEPAARRGFLPRENGGRTADEGRERERTGQFRLVRARFLHPFHAPASGCFVPEQADRGAGGAQGGFVHRHRLLRHIHEHRFQPGRVADAHFAGSTKRSITRFCPAFSKSMSSRSSSTAVTRP